LWPRTVAKTICTPSRWMGWDGSVGGSAQHFVAAADGMDGRGAWQHAASRCSVCYCTRPQGRATAATAAAILHGLPARSQMVHANVLDTAVMFPHPRGPPARSALRVLASRHLRRTIQTGEPVAGCSPQGAAALPHSCSPRPASHCCAPWAHVPLLPMLTHRPLLPPRLTACAPQWPPPSNAVRYAGALLLLQLPPRTPLPAPCRLSRPGGGCAGGAGPGTTQDCARPRVRPASDAAARCRPTGRRPQRRRQVRAVPRSAMCC
jgi:hypothetical protein